MIGVNPEREPPLDAAVLDVTYTLGGGRHYGAQVAVQFFRREPDGRWRLWKPNVERLVVETGRMVLLLG